MNAHVRFVYIDQLLTVVTFALSPSLPPPPPRLPFESQ